MLLLGSMLAGRFVQNMRLAVSKASNVTFRQGLVKRLINSKAVACSRKLENSGVLNEDASAVRCTNCPVASSSAFLQSRAHVLSPHAPNAALVYLQALAQSGRRASQCLALGTRRQTALSAWLVLT